VPQDQGPSFRQGGDEHEFLRKIRKVATLPVTQRYPSRKAASPTQYLATANMAKDKIDQAREKRFQMEIVVDCYNESERYSGWICYLEDKLEFPFRARCIAPRKSSPLKSGEKVEIMSMLDEDCGEPSEIFVQARWQGRELGLPLAQLEGIGVSNQTAEAIADWHYWCARGYCF
jgi:hypothetical protein